VIIEGFKSYKDQTIVEPFSRDINVVGECIAAACGTVTLYILSRGEIHAQFGMLLQWAQTAPASRISSTVRPCRHSNSRLTHEPLLSYVFSMLGWGCI